MMVEIGVIDFAWFVHSFERVQKAKSKIFDEGPRVEYSSLANHSRCEASPPFHLTHPDNQRANRSY